MALKKTFRKIKSRQDIKQKILNEKIKKVESEAEERKKKAKRFYNICRLKRIYVNDIVKQ
jgi:hypothetical protein